MIPAAASSALGQEVNVLVVGGGQGTWLAAVAQKVDGEEIARNENDVVNAIVKLARAGQVFSAIELISHTGPDNLLRFGGWSLREGAFANAGAEFRDILRGIGKVRLAGCFSACGEAARAALRYLESEFNVEAEGTIRGVGTRHLISTGTNPEKRPGLFVPTANVIPSAVMGGFDIAKQLADLGTEQTFGSDEIPQLAGRLSSDSQAVLRAALAITGSTYFDAPGILRIPDSWRELRDAGGRVVGGIGLMFDAELLHLEVVGSPGGSEKVFAVPADQRSALRSVLAK